MKDTFLARVAAIRNAEQMATAHLESRKCAACGKPLLPQSKRERCARCGEERHRNWRERVASAADCSSPVYVER